MFVVLQNMTEEERIHLKKFDARVRRLIADFRMLQQENSDLYSELENREREIAELKSQLEQSKRDYSNLKLARMIEISNDDFKETKQRVTLLVREVNRCINLLSASEDDLNDDK